MTEQKVFIFIILSIVGAVSAVVCFLIDFTISEMYNGEKRSQQCTSTPLISDKRSGGDDSGLLWALLVRLHHIRDIQRDILCVVSLSGGARQPLLRRFVTPSPSAAAAVAHA